MSPKKRVSRAKFKRTTDGVLLPTDGKTYMEKWSITPKIAGEWMKRNTNNRPCHEGAVDKLADAMENGEWNVNGEAIKFRMDGVLSDGQGRLCAVIKSGVTLRTWVVFGVTEDAFDTIDQGRRRSIGHVFARNNLVHYNTIAAAVVWLYRIDDNIPTTPGGLRAATAKSILADRPQLPKSHTFVFSREIRAITSLGMAAALHHEMHKLNPDDADSFWESLRDGATGKRNPLRILRDKMIGNRGSAKKNSPTYMAAITIKAWNLRRRGKTCVDLKWDPDREQFPQLV